MKENLITEVWIKLTNVLKRNIICQIGKDSVQTYIDDCEICQQSKYEKNSVKIK